MTNPMRLTKGEVIVGKILTEQGITFADATSLTTAPLIPYYGQVGSQTLGTVTIGTAGTYQSTGLTASLDTTANLGVSLGTADAFAIKNTTGNTRVFKVFASYDGVSSGGSKVFGLRLALNGTPIANSDCRATTSAAGAIAKLLTTHLLELQNNDEVAMYVANHTTATNIQFQRGRIVATTVD
jgi:hypothetical protein